MLIILIVWSVFVGGAVRSHYHDGAKSGQHETQSK